MLLPLALRRGARHRLAARPGRLEAELPFELSGDNLSLAVVERVGRHPPSEINGRRDDVNLGVLMLVVLDSGIHAPVELFKFGEPHDDPHLLRARKGVVGREAEDRVQHADLDVGPQRREGLEAPEQLLLRAPGRVRDENFSSLRAFSISRTVGISISLTSRVIISRSLFYRPRPVRLPALFGGRLVAHAQPLRRPARLYLRRRPVLGVEQVVQQAAEAPTFENFYDHYSPRRSRSPMRLISSMTRSARCRSIPTP